MTAVETNRRLIDFHFSTRPSVISFFVDTLVNAAALIGHSFDSDDKPLTSHIYRILVFGDVQSLMSSFFDLTVWRRWNVWLLNVVVAHNREQKKKKNMYTTESMD